MIFIVITELTFLDVRIFTPLSFVIECLNMTSTHDSNRSGHNGHIHQHNISGKENDVLSSSFKTSPAFKLISHHLYDISDKLTDLINITLNMDVKMSSSFEEVTKIHFKSLSQQVYTSSRENEMYYLTASSQMVNLSDVVSGVENKLDNLFTLVSSSKNGSVCQEKPLFTQDLSAIRKDVNGLNTKLESAIALLRDLGGGKDRKFIPSKDTNSIPFGDGNSKDPITDRKTSPGRPVISVGSNVSRTPMVKTTPTSVDDEGWDCACWLKSNSSQKKKKNETSINSQDQQSRPSASHSTNLTSLTILCSLCFLSSSVSTLIAIFIYVKVGTMVSRERSRLMANGGGNHHQRFNSMSSTPPNSPYTTQVLELQARRFMR